MRKLKKETQIVRNPKTIYKKERNWSKRGKNGEIVKHAKISKLKKFKNGKKSQKRPKITERDKIRLKKNYCESFTNKKQPGNHENCTKCLAKRKNEKRIK